MVLRQNNNVGKGKAKCWRETSKERVGTKQEKHHKLPVYSEKKWLRFIHKIYIDGMNNKLTIIQYHIVDPTLTPTEKLKLKDMLNLLSNNTTGQRFHICLTSRTELTQEEKRKIIGGAHGSLTS